MELITLDDRQRLFANARARAINPSSDPIPVVKLFTPDAGGTWLLSELDPEDPDRAFGLCDLGLGSPELGWVSLAELAALRGPLGLPIERDIAFAASRSLSAYERAARQMGVVIA